METLALNNPFYTFQSTSKKIKGVATRKLGVGEFEQIVPDVSVTPIRKTSEYLLDSLSEIFGNQNLSQEQITRSKTKVINEKLDSLSQKYEIAKFENVKNFVLNNRILIKLLEEIPDKVSQYFENNQTLRLEVIYEPDFPESKELWVSILTELPAKESLPIFDKFNEEWWFENSDLADCKLAVTLKHI